MKDINQQLEELRIELAAQKFERGKNWKGYEVYIPLYSKPVYIGLPLIVLVKNGGARISTADESLDYLDFENAESNAKSLYEN